MSLNVVILESDDGKFISLPSSIIKRSEYFDMLNRHHSGFGPIKTGLSFFDLKLSVMICELNVYPSTYQKKMKPENFRTCKELVEYIGAMDAKSDGRNDYLNRFLSSFGLVEDEGDEYEDLYEGWTPQMIREQRQEDIVDEMDDSDEEYEEIEDL